MRIIITTTLTLLAAPLTLLAPPASADQLWGAIAYDYLGNAQAATNYTNAAEAQLAAQQACGAGCGAFSFPQCGTVAATREAPGVARSLMTAGGSTQGQASSAARDSCEQQFLKACVTLITACNG